MHKEAARRLQEDTLELKSASTSKVDALFCAKKCIRGLQGCRKEAAKRLQGGCMGAKSESISKVAALFGPKTP